MFTLDNWEAYNDTPAPIFRTRREAEKVADSLRQLRAWVVVVEVGGN